jgi:squalene cyclase
MKPTAAFTAFACIATLAFTPARAADPVDEALERGIKYLVQQQEGNGAIINKGRRNETAMTSLALLALASCGHQPGDPTPEGQAMRKALAYLLQPDVQTDDGYFGDKDNSRMYGHGITTLTLAEMLGMGADRQQDELLRTKVRKAIDLILRSQRVSKNDNNRGGWRYTPGDTTSDMSVTVWQVMALRAARNAGLDVPKEAIDDAVKYIKRLYEPAGEKRGKLKPGGFGYQSKGHEISTTAEGLLALQVCGEYDAEETLGAAERLFQEGVRLDERWFYYATYYYAQGMYQRGGEYAERGRQKVSESLLSLQSREGSWESGGGDGREAGKVYATSMAILSLAVKNHFLPIYQR